LPFDDAEELVILQHTIPSEGVTGRNPGVHDFLDWREQQTSFEDLAAFYGATMNVSGGAGPPVRYSGSFVTPALFQLIGTRPLHGRWFREDESGTPAALVTIIGHDIWRDRFDRSPNVLGQSLRVNGTLRTIVGVMPEQFVFPLNDDLWLPLPLDPLGTPRGEGRGHFVLGRLLDSVSRTEAHAEMQAIAARLAVAYPDTNAGGGVGIDGFADEFVGNEVGGLLTTMLAAVFGVLLIACANVANLMLARTAIRTKEMAIRTALGASRSRIVSQLVAEAFVLATGGALLGVWLAQIGIRLFNNAIANLNPPFWVDVEIDLWVGAFILGLTVLSTLLCGLAPALRASRTDVNAALADGSRGASGLRMGTLSRSLVVAEVALSCGLLVATGLAVQSIANLRSLAMSFPTDDVFMARMTLPSADYPAPSDQRRFWNRLLARLQQTAGTGAVALTSGLPALGSQGARFSIEGAVYPTDRDDPVSRRAVATPGFFDVFEASALRGRLFNQTDGRDAPPVVVVNASFARRFFPGQNALGTRIRERQGGPDAPWMTIVGVVPDLWMWDVESQDEHPAGYYVPLAQQPMPSMVAVIRSKGDPLSLTPTVRDAVASLDSTLPIYDVGSLALAIDDGAWTFRIFGTLFIAFGLAALLLASIGLYGVMAFSTGQRTREIGVRMALGARRADVVGLVLAQAATQVGFGVTIGLAVAAVLSRLLAQLLFGVEPWNAGIFAGVVLILVTVGLAASFVPARRATRVDPTIALRYE